MALSNFRLATRLLSPGTAWIAVFLICSASAAETKVGKIKNKPGSGRNCTSAKIAKNNGDMTITPPPGATVTGPKAGSTGTWEVTGLNIPPGGEAEFTFTNNNGTVNYHFISFDYKNAAGKTVWTGKCNDPIAFHVLSGGPDGENYLGYPIPSGHYGYFYQMYPNATNSTTVLRAHIHLGPGNGAYNFQVLPNRFPFLPSPGFDLDDIQVPLMESPDGYEYEVLAPYMDPANAQGIPGISTNWSFNPATNIATMDFTGTGGLSFGQTGSIVAFTSPYPPTVTPGNVDVDYLGGVEPPCTGTFAPDTLVPAVPDVPEFTYQALPELPGGAGKAFNINAPVAIDGGDGVDTIVAVGQSRDLDLIDKAVLWSRPNGVTWELTPLPNPFGNTESSAVALAKVRQAVTNELEEFSIGGYVRDFIARPRPIAWSYNQGAWIAELLPVPPPYDSGAIQAMNKAELIEQILKDRKAGWLRQASNLQSQRAAFWKKDQNAIWTVDLLPNNGPAFPSRALCFTHDNVHEDDVHIGGAVGSGTSPELPVVWHSMPIGGYERVDLAMTPGAYLGAVTDIAMSSPPDSGVFAVGYNASVAGLADRYRGVLYRRSIDEVWNQPLALPPLPGMRDSRATSISVGGDATTGKKLFVGGLSYVELSPGSERATLWEIGPDDTIITYDLTEHTRNVPPAVTLKSGSPRNLSSSRFPGVLAVAGYSEMDGIPGVPHAFVATPQPPPDPLRTISPTQVHFGSGDLPPIPADFFNPGSLPFEGVINLKGRSISANSYASTVIQRRSALNCPGPGPLPRPCETIPIEIVALNLTSISPIVVSGPSGSLWNVDVSLSPVDQPTGGLAAMLQHNNGGTFGCFLPVIPIFRFTNVDNPADIRILDYGALGHPYISIQFSNVPWVANMGDHLSSQVIAPSDGNFVPLVIELVPGDPTSQVGVIATGNSGGGGVIHTVGPQPPPPPPDPHRTIDPTFVQFGGPGIPAIPAGFFDPGSEPFNGIILLHGASQDSRDTVVQRASALDLFSPQNSIPIELVSLNLVSINPITVNSDLGPTQWSLKVEIDRALYPDAWVGQLDTTMNGPNGGTFDAVIPFQPKLTFTDVANPARTRILGLNELAPLQLSFANVPFVVNLAPHLQGVIDAPSNGNFVPGVLEQIPGQPPTQVVVQASGVRLGGGVTHTIGPPVGPRLIPAGQDCWETICGQTQYDFSATPIPIGFFNVEPDDNTLMFDEIVKLEDAGSSTIMRRCTDALFDSSLPSSANVPIELVSLHLRSCTPIAVQDCCKPAELWNVEVTLSPTLPPPCSGNMTLTKTHANGGTFDSQFPVQALFRFARVNPPVVTYEFDTALAGYGPELMNSQQPFDFVQRLYDPETAQACGVNFVPGVAEYLGRNPTEQYPQCCTPPRCHQFLGGSLHCTAPADCSKCPGACCNPATGACSHITAEQCASAGGTFKGIRSKCADTDGDGIADDFETGTCCGPRDLCNTGTDPMNPDSDGDGIVDGAELSNGFDPCDPCDPNPSSPGCPPQGSDCNGNSALDICDVANGTSADCDENNIPDECQPDCDFDACADACEIICGSQLDANENGIPDDCEGGGNAPNPVVANGDPKVKFISFDLPNNSSGETALRIKLITLHAVSPPYSAAPTIPFTAFQGLSVYVGPPSQFVESVSSGTPFMSAQTQCAPHYRNWNTVGTLHVRGSAIVPSSLYAVEHLAASCQGNEGSAACQSGGASVSAPVQIATRRWGDLETPYNPPSSTTQPDLADVAALVNKFRGAIGAPIKARAIIAPNNVFGTITDATMSVDVGFTHIASCVDAFRGARYPSQMGQCAGAPTTPCTANTDCGANGPCILYCP